MYVSFYYLGQFHGFIKYLYNLQTTSIVHVTKSREAKFPRNPQRKAEIGWKNCFLSLKKTRLIMKDVKITLNTKRIAFNICSLKSSTLIKLSSKSLLKDLTFEMEKSPSTMNVKIPVVTMMKLGNLCAAFSRRAFAFVESITFSGSRRSRNIWFNVFRKRCSSGDNLWTLFLKILPNKETTDLSNFLSKVRLLLSLSKSGFICR